MYLILCVSFYGVRAVYVFITGLILKDQDLDTQHLQGNGRRQSHAASISISHDHPEVASIPSRDSATFRMPKPLLPMARPYSLPRFIHPVPAKYGADEIAYLAKKGALTIPALPLRNALLQCFVNYVHPYMPLLDLHELLHTIETEDESSCVSLLLFQAIMFASTASVDMKYLKAAGYRTRRDARRDFFQKTRVSIVYHSLQSRKLTLLLAPVRL